MADSHSYRDAMVSGQIPYFTQHPQYSNLTIAGRGSYTHWKDLPTIDQSIVKASDWQPKEASKQRYGWHRKEDLSEADSQLFSALDENMKPLKRRLGSITSRYKRTCQTCQIYRIFTFDALS